jgi:mannosyltransferase OCH1-like enzyme
MSIDKLNSHKSPDTDQIAADFITAGGRTIRSEIHKLINFMWNKEEFPEQWMESISVPVHE